MSWQDSIRQIIGTTLNVIAQVRPFIEPLRQAIPALDDIADKVEDVVDQGERIADDFIDQHDGDLEKVEHFAFATGDALICLGEFVAQARASASLTDDTPDEITLEEGKQLIEKGEELFEKLQNSYTTLSGVSESLDNLAPETGTGN